MSEAVEPVTTSYLRALLIDRLAGSRGRGHWRRAIERIVIDDRAGEGPNWTVRTAANPSDTRAIEVAAFSLMAKYPRAVEG